MTDQGGSSNTELQTQRHQLNVMLELQDKMNARVHSDWQSQNFQWYRAIWTECAETLDHYGWKWWKKQTPDRDQVCMELVDIWHFGLSILLLEGMSPAELISQLQEPQANSSDFRELLEEFTAATLSTKSFDLGRFRRLMVAVEMSMDDLYIQYVGKNVLNFFRQDHGYQDGSYQKIWDGKEDNEHLVEVLDELNPSLDNFADTLYKELEVRYPGT